MYLSLDRLLVSTEPKVEVFYSTRTILSEGPCYDQANNELVWVDIDGQSINFLDLTTRENRTFKMGNYVGAAIPCASGKSAVASIGKRVVLVDRETGTQRELTSVEPDKPNNRINDCKCDRKGRFWFGTMGIHDKSGVSPPNQGSLYSYDGVQVKKFMSDVSVSNGMAWSLDWTKMYYIDSPTRKIYRFDYNEETGDLTNRETTIDFKEDKTHGLPDGMTIDSEGKIWVAEFHGGCVCRWDPATGEMLQRIPIPALKTTSCCFGGPNYDTLFVTSCSMGYTPEELEKKNPEAGFIFAVTGLGVKGMPPQFFDDSKITN